MCVFRKKSKPGSPARISRSEALACIPARHVLATENRLESGDVVVTCPIPHRPWMAGWMRLTGKTSASAQMKRIELDEFGTIVWDLINGKRSVWNIIQRFSEISRMHPNEAEVSVTLFLRELGKRGMIGLKQQEADSG